MKLNKSLRGMLPLSKQSADLYVSHFTEDENQSHEYGDQQVLIANGTTPKITWE